MKSMQLIKKIEILPKTIIWLLSSDSLSIVSLDITQENMIIQNSAILKQ